MQEFKDANGLLVRLSFKKDSFSKQAQHVLVICRFNTQWLLTKHKVRGLEFPGGKLEMNETAEQAARREVNEETGGVLKELFYIGEYEVGEGPNSFVKAIFYGEVEGVLVKDHYMETDGPILVGDELLEARQSNEYSYIMKDLVIEKSVTYVMEQFKHTLKS